MGEYLILEFETQESATNCLNILNQVAAAWWIEQGYTVENTEDGLILIGKNSKTGEDDPSGITTTWDTVKESPDGTFYFTSPTPDPRFVDWRNYMPEGIDLGTEKEMPEEWMNNGE